MSLPCIILKDAQLAENIGAAARVMANFGLSELRLVSPRDGWPQPRAWASASGADWLQALQARGKFALQINFHHSGLLHFAEQLFGRWR